MAAICPQCQTEFDPRTGRHLPSKFVRCPNKPYLETMRELHEEWRSL